MLTSLIAIATLSLAAQPQTTAFKIPRNNFAVPAYPGAFLLHWGLVQSDMNLGPEIVEGLDLSRKANDSQTELIMRNPGDRSLNRDHMSEAAIKALAQLTGAQKKRLGELYLQFYDVNALVDPTVAGLVGLSQTQRDSIRSRFTVAYWKHLDAQEAMFETYRKDREELRKKLQPKDGEVPTRSISYTLPRDVQYRHGDLSRQARLVQVREMTAARADVRKLLSPAQSAKFDQLQGKRIPQWFFEGGNWGVAQPHPELALNIHVMAEMGFTLKEYLQIQKQKSDPNLAQQVASRLTPKQRAIFRGCQLQYDGEYSILRHDITKELGIHPDVQDQIMLRLEEIEAEARRKADFIFVNNTESSAYAEREVILRQADDDKRAAISSFLTKKQLAKWKAMLGTPLPQIQPTRSYG